MLFRGSFIRQNFAQNKETTAFYYRLRKTRAKENGSLKPPVLNLRNLRMCWLARSAEHVMLWCFPLSPRLKMIALSERIYLGECLYEKGS
jgi:hypothetical protein